jgi:hypothetical protein
MTNNNHEIVALKSEAIDTIAKELDKANDKFPLFNSPHEGYAVLIEEVEELKAEVFKRNQSKERMIAEATQVGAMAAKFIISLEA